MINKTFLKYYLPILIWAFLIFYFSSLPNLKSGLASELDLVLRKAAHMIEFGILAILFLRIGLRNEKSQNRKLVYSLAILLSVLYAISDEYHQGFVVGREATARDVLIDTIGIIGGTGIYINSKKG